MEIFSLYHARLCLYLSSLIRERKETHGINLNRSFQIKTKDLKKLFNFTIKKANSTLRIGLFPLKIDKENIKNLSYKNGTLDIEFTQNGYDTYYKLTSHIDNIVTIQDAIRMNSFNAFKIFFLILKLKKKHENIISFFQNINEFKENIFGNTDIYQRIYDLKHRVLEPSFKQLDKNRALGASYSMDKDIVYIHCNFHATIFTKPIL